MWPCYVRSWPVYTSKHSQLIGQTALYKYHRSTWVCTHHHELSCPMGNILHWPLWFDSSRSIMIMWHGTTVVTTPFDACVCTHMLCDHTHLVQVFCVPHPGTCCGWALVCFLTQIHGCSPHPQVLQKLPELLVQLEPLLVIDQTWCSSPHEVVNTAASLSKQAVGTRSLIPSTIHLVIHGWSLWGMWDLATMAGSVGLDVWPMVMG